MPPRPAPLHLPKPEAYPERRDQRFGRLDIAWREVEGIFLKMTRKPTAIRLARKAARATALEGRMVALDDAALKDEILRLRSRLRVGGIDRGPVIETFAAIREVARRVLGMRPYDVQLVGGFALLEGRLAEMEPGEGKTLTATLAAGTAGLVGEPVHIVTVNDYLAERDHREMAPLFAFLGLKLGLIVHGLKPEERRRAYARDVVYCSNKELAFDYLRDRTVLGGQRGNLHVKMTRLKGDDGRDITMRGLHFAIVDEADSVLIDEARTPLILSRTVDARDEKEDIHRALEIARRMEPERHYRILTGERRVALGEAGKQFAEDATVGFGGVWRIPIIREEMVRMALSAIHLHHPDEHYLVQDGKLAIIDEYTGRLVPDRHWSEGLHQMIEAKEGCEISEQHVTLARITYQRFFRRYGRLAGMTGTATEVAREFWSVYRLPVVELPTNRPNRRRRLADRVFLTHEQKWSAVTEEVRRCLAAERPVLVGTRSVAAAQSAAEYLDRAGIAYNVLTAAQDQDEAQVVAMAGQAGRVTIATNMAGRGTDIKLGKGVAEAGGLHVIISERHDAARIDRQLAGRSARQGDPGSVGAILSLADAILDQDRVVLGRGLVTRLMPVLGTWLGGLALRRAQRAAERIHSRMRRDLMRLDRRLSDMLSFSGVQE